MLTDQKGRQTERAKGDSPVRREIRDLAPVSAAESVRAMGRTGVASSKPGNETEKAMADWMNCTCPGFEPYPASREEDPVRAQQWCNRCGCARGDACHRRKA